VCDTCDGNCRSEEDSHYEELDAYILNTIPREAREAIVFTRAYLDGTVDTEYTFTIATEAVRYVPDVIRAFQGYCDNNGGDFNSDNAGFHIAVLTERTYPCQIGLNREKLDNFKSQVTRLLPALMHEASPDRYTRGLEYRHIKIREYDGDSSNKYSAIYIQTGAMEYRVFDPCYDDPEYVFEYIQAIASTLRYYSKRKLKANLYDRYEIPQINGTRVSLGKLFEGYDNITALQNTLRYINPNSKLKISMPSEKRQIRLKYAKQCKLIKQYQEHIESKNRDCEQRLHRDWLQLNKAKAQAKSLEDLTKITAQEYVDIERDRQYAPTVIREQIGSDGGMRVTASRFLELYRNEFRPLAFTEFTEQLGRYSNNTSVITG
jgi:hypothetical protein